jgi:hypothetical protein
MPWICHPLAMAGNLEQERLPMYLDSANKLLAEQTFKSRDNCVHLAYKEMTPRRKQPCSDKNIPVHVADVPRSNVITRF